MRDCAEKHRRAKLRGAALRHRPLLACLAVLALVAGCGDILGIHDIGPEDSGAVDATTPDGATRDVTAEEAAAAPEASATDVADVTTASDAGGEAAAADGAADASADADAGAPASDASVLYVTWGPTADAGAAFLVVDPTGGGTVLSSVALNDHPYWGQGTPGIALSPDGTTAYVVSNGSWSPAAEPSLDQIDVIDLTVSPPRVVTSVPLSVNEGPSAAPTGIAVSKDGRKVYVPCYGGQWAGTETGWITVVDTADGGLESFHANTANARPLGLAFNPEGTEFWFGCGGAPDCAEVHAYPGNAMTHTIDVSTLTGGGIAVLPDGGDAFFANNCGCCGTFMRVNESSQSVTDTVSGDNGGAMAFTPDWKYALWSHSNNCAGGDGVVVQIDTSNDALGPSLTLPTSSGSNAVAVTSDGASFYVIVNGQVWKADVASMTQTATLTSIPPGADSLALPPSP